jgi:hypothetical protein
MSLVSRAHFYKNRYLYIAYGLFVGTATGRPQIKHKKEEK